MENYYSGSHSAIVPTFTDQAILGPLGRTRLDSTLETRAGGRIGLSVILRNISDSFDITY